MMSTVRTKNLDLIRHIYGGQQSTADKLVGVANYTRISQMATGVGSMSDSEARAIEEKLKLPSGWMDRDNFSLLDINDAEFKIISKISKCSPLAKEGLLNFLNQ